MVLSSQLMEVWLKGFSRMERCYLKFNVHIWLRTEVLADNFNVRLTPATSTGRRNTCVKSFCRRFELQRFAGPFV